MQKGSIGQRNKYVASLLEQISNLKDQNQQLVESANNANSATAAVFLNGGIPASQFRTGNLISSNDSLNVLTPRSFGGAAFPTLVDPNHNMIFSGSVPNNNFKNSALSSPLYIQDTSSAIYKILNGRH